MTVLYRYTWYTGDTISIRSPFTSLFDKDRVGEVSEVSEVSPRTTSDFLPEWILLTFFDKLFPK